MNRDTETVPARHETPDLAELRRLAEAATPGPWEAFGAVDGRRGERWLGVTTDMRAIESARAGDVFAAQNCTRQDALFIAAANPATVLALLDDADERDALRTWQERVALAAGLADEVAGYGVHLEADPDTAAEHVAGLLDIADTHVECPIYCGDCGEPLADTPCDHCGGSGCGPGTGSGAYEECGWCAGAGKVHVGCAHLSYAELCAERDALAAKLGAVREWIDRRGVNVGDRDDDYMRGYRDAQRHALLDAAELRWILDAETGGEP